MCIEDDILSQALTYARMGLRQSCRSIGRSWKPVQGFAPVESCTVLLLRSTRWADCSPWCAAATKDGRQLTEWFAGTRHNIGIATGEVSNLIVLDIDPRHGGDATLACFERLHGKLPPTVRFKTGGGGQHILFRHPGGCIPNSAGKIGPGVDVRATAATLSRRPQSTSAAGFMWSTAVLLRHHTDRRHARHSRRRRDRTDSQVAQSQECC